MTVTDDEVRASAPRASRTIGIEAFVDLDETDPVHFEQPCSRVPDREAAKPYRLRVDATTDLGEVAMGRFVLRPKLHRVAIRPLDGVVRLATMRDANEIVPVADVMGTPGGDDERRAERARARDGPSAGGGHGGRARSRGMPRRLRRGGRGPA